MNTKKFVKAKPLSSNVSKEEPPQTRENRNQNSKKYEEKQRPQSKDPRSHISFVLKNYQLMERNENIDTLCKTFPNVFVRKSIRPEPEEQGSLSEYLWLGNRRDGHPKVIKQMSSDSSDPDWDSDEDKEVKLVSKKINDSIVEKISIVNSNKPFKRFDDLQRHEREFLEEHYRNKRKQEEVNQNHSKDDEKETVIQEKLKSAMEQTHQDDGDWDEYDPNVGALITEGIIQKMDIEEEDDFSFDEDSRSEKESSSGDDDMFADDGPRTVTKTKTDKDDKEKGKTTSIVRISTHLFSEIAEEVGFHPEASIWIVSDKPQSKESHKFKVSTFYMNDYYKGEFSTLYPYVSLNFSEFVHKDDFESDKGLEKFKKYNSRRQIKNGQKKKFVPTEVGNSANQTFRITVKKLFLMKNRQEKYQKLESFEEKDGEYFFLADTQNF